MYSDAKTCSGTFIFFLSTFVMDLKSRANLKFQSNIWHSFLLVQSQSVRQEVYALVFAALICDRSWTLASTMPHDDPKLSWQTQTRFTWGIITDQEAPLQKCTKLAWLCDFFTYFQLLIHVIFCMMANVLMQINDKLNKITQQCFWHFNFALLWTSMADCVVAFVFCCKKCY